jgi:D-alanyl-lipoteichoic acid acyltransferase DltB (MBOAT superfamily)
MLFNSSGFLLFFALFFAAYHGVAGKIKNGQNILLLAGGCFFYGCAGWKILPAILAAAACFYALGIAIENARTTRAKSRLTLLGVVAGIGVLLWFKYTNFLIGTCADLLSALGFAVHAPTLSILLPVGISFWIFRLLSYVIDIGRGRSPAERDFVSFAAYVTFFPCVLSGPIDRPCQFLPQLKTPRVFDYALAMDGLRQFFWGLFKKIAVADVFAVPVRTLCETPGEFSSKGLFVGMFAMLIWLYADFSGYSDMAIGISKLLGLRVSRNFNCPLFAQNIADYWQRWHMSLTSWLTDYVFMPLNIRWRDHGKTGMCAAIIITFLLIGAWHGANWTFLLFGLYHGLLYIPLVAGGGMMKKHKLTALNSGLPAPSVVARAAVTLLLVAFGQVLFNAPTTGAAVEYVARMLSFTDGTYGMLGKANASAFLKAAFLVGAEWFARDKEHALALVSKIRPAWGRMLVYYALLVVMLAWMSQAPDSGFVYFQF